MPGECPAIFLKDGWNRPEMHESLFKIHVRAVMVLNQACQQLPSQLKAGTATLSWWTYGGNLIRMLQKYAQCVRSLLIPGEVKLTAYLQIGRKRDGVRPTSAIYKLCAAFQLLPPNFGGLFGTIPTRDPGCKWRYQWKWSRRF